MKYKSARFNQSIVRRRSLTPLKLAKTVAEIVTEKKAEDVVILDMRKVANFCDYFVILSGNSDRQVRALGETLIDELRELGVDSVLKQGLKEGSWVVLDVGDVLIHIFQKDLREFYQLEYLWQEAKEVKWP